MGQNEPRPVVSVNDYEKLYLCGWAGVWSSRGGLELVLTGWAGVWSSRGGLELVHTGWAGVWSSQGGW